MSSRAYQIGLNLLITVIFTYLIAAVTLLSGYMLSTWIFPISFILASIATCAWNRDITLNIRSGFASLTIIILSVVAATYIEDNSYDGNCYHQEIIARLMYGWNPYHEFNKATTDGFSISGISIWAMHYAKAIEISCASIGMLTGSVESGKAINIIIILASFFLIYGFAGSLLNKRNRLTILTIAIFSAGNPVGLTQLTTFYVDFTKYYLIVFIILQTYNIITCNKLRDYMLLCGITVFAIGIKFNIFFETGIALFAAIAWCAYHRLWSQAVKISLTGLFAFIIGTSIINYHPYITNYLSAGHPLFPLMGEDAHSGIITQAQEIETSEFYHGHGRVVNFIISIFSLQLPTYSGRVGGFGPLMPVMMVLSMICLIIHYRKLRVYRYIAIVTLLSCFLFDTSWWARFIPQLWLVPVIIAFGVTANIHTNISTVFSRTIIGCGLLSALLALGQGIRFSRGATMVRHKLYETIKTEPNLPVRVKYPSLQMANHFELEKIVWEEMPSDEPLDSANAVMWHHNDGNFPLIQLTPCQKLYLDSAAGRYTRHDSWSLIPQ